MATVLLPLCVMHFIHQAVLNLIDLRSPPQNPVNGLRVDVPAVHTAVANGNEVLTDSDDHVSEFSWEPLLLLFQWWVDGRGGRPFRPGSNHSARLRPVTHTGSRGDQLRCASCRAQSSCFSCIVLHLARPCNMTPLPTRAVWERAVEPMNGIKGNFMLKLCQGVYPLAPFG